MHRSILGVFSLALLVAPALTAATKKNNPTPCGVGKLAPCASTQVCVKPGPGIPCSAANPDKCPGTCQPACSLTSTSLPCLSGQRCQTLPQPSIMQTGYCVPTPQEPQPAFCGGFANIQCQNADEECVDNLNDTCDPNNGGRDCGGICVKKTQRLCDSRGLPPCYADETCVHDPKSTCSGAQDCPGVCEKKRLCAGISGLQCLKGERCVDDTTNKDCTGGIAADCPGVCIK